MPPITLPAIPLAAGAFDEARFAPVHIGSFAFVTIFTVDLIAFSDALSSASSECASSWMVCAIW